MEVTTPRERRAFIFAKLQAAAVKLANRTDFDFTATDPRINKLLARTLEDNLNQRIIDFINGDCRAEEVQAAWIEYAKAHQLKEPEPQSLFGKESTDGKQQQATSKRARSKGRGTGKATREWRDKD